ncbi:TRAP transporter large permease [Robertmurraya massiliosenegalensis]|uniref:TRAP transporter large permease n=1 Tax=Robertmurraya massiliosenegalensis TaxID=1287657 RepID=UPI00031200E9|nr:TRAP transporter large permease [Robertmurraya massiliosenegalensis]
MSALLILLFFFILVLIGVPVAYSFGFSSLIYIFVALADNSSVLITRSFGAVDSFALMAIPFFIFAGDIMKEAKISNHLVNFLSIFTRKIKGSLSHLTVIASTFFGAISGSSAATVAAIGGVMIPEMVKKGYDRSFAVAIAAASGFLGILIPPSVPLIVYGLNAEVSVSMLFLGGIIPGLLMAIGFMTVNHFMIRKYKINENINGLDEGEVESASAKEVNRPTRSFILPAIPAILMPLIILGGIYSGVFTPTESGAIAVAYGILAAFFYYKSITGKKLLQIAGRSAITSAVILIMVSLAGVFGYIITVERLPSFLAETILSWTNNTFVILLLLNIIYLILGTFMETITAIIITTPIFLPLVQMMGIDLVHFGIIQTTNLCIGLITPPMALNLLMASKIANVSVMKTTKPLLPYLLISIVVLLLVTYIPEITLFLPNLLKN